MGTPAGTARAESPSAKTLVKLSLTNVFATSTRRSICFRSDEEIEAVPAESVRLKWKLILIGFGDNKFY